MLMKKLLDLYCKLPDGNVILQTLKSAITITITITTLLNVTPLRIKSLRVLL
jgi:hypothetical protein